MKTIINANQMGILYQNGAPKAILSAGKYVTFGSKKIEVMPVEEEIIPAGCTIEQLLSLSGAEKLIAVEEVGAEELSAHLVNGRVAGFLERGSHAFWSVGVNHEFHRYSTSAPEMCEEAIRDFLAAENEAGDEYYIEISVRQSEKARLYINGKLDRVLCAGKYYFWNTQKNEITVEGEDMRERRLVVNGQEILTADKVGLRVNFTAFYKVTDVEKVALVCEDLVEYLYSAAQLVLREYISKYKVDEILESREQIANEVIEALRNRTAGAYVEITSAGIRDIILPGEIADIMNSVLAAEKRAQANVITRREEVASTRSLLNTAKLMDENATLRKLKELEYLERICENVGGITVDGSRDLLTQLASVVTGSRS